VEAVEQSKKDNRQSSFRSETSDKLAAALVEADRAVSEMKRPQIRATIR
jgi:hypothetical protein